MKVKWECQVRCRRSRSRKGGKTDKDHVFAGPVLLAVRAVARWCEGDRDRVDVTGRTKDREDFEPTVRMTFTIAIRPTRIRVSVKRKVRYSAAAREVCKRTPGTSAASGRGRLTRAAPGQLRNLDQRAAEHAHTSLKDSHRRFRPRAVQPLLLGLLKCMRRVSCLGQANRARGGCPHTLCFSFV